MTARLARHWRKAISPLRNSSAAHRSARRSSGMSVCFCKTVTVRSGESHLLDMLPYAVRSLSTSNPAFAAGGSSVRLSVQKAERLVGACPKTRPRYRGSVHSTEEIACQSQEVVVVGPFDTNWPSKNCQSPTPAIAMTAKPGAAAPLPSMLCYRRRYCRSQAKLANFPLMPENASPRSILPVLPVRPGWPIVMLQFPAWWFYAPALWTAATNSSLRFIFGRSASSDGLPFQNQHHPSMKRQARPSLRPPCRAKFSWSEAVVPEAGQSLP